MLFYLLSRKSSGPLPPTTSFSGCPFSRHFGEKIRTELDAEINLQPLSTLYFINDRFCCLFKPVLLPWPIHGMAMAVKERWPFSQPAAVLRWVCTSQTHWWFSIAINAEISCRPFMNPTSCCAHCLSKIFTTSIRHGSVIIIISRIWLDDLFCLYPRRQIYVARQKCSSRVSQNEIKLIIIIIALIEHLMRWVSVWIAGNVVAVGFGRSLLGEIHV